MQTVASPTAGVAERRATYVPKLSYRNSGTNDSIEVGSRASSSTFGTALTDSHASTLLTNPISAPQSPVESWAKPGSHGSSSSLASPRSPPPDARSMPKKKSLFTGIFSTKEPSMAAFEQMKHIEATHPNFKPYTSNRKLPAEAPKVTSKWDGMPRNKEREKHVRKPSPSRLSQSSSGRSRSADRSESSKGGQRPSASTGIPLTTRSPGSAGDFHAPFTTQHDNPSSSTAVSSAKTDSIFGDGDTRIMGDSIRTESLKPPSLPDLTSYFPTQPPEVQQNWANMPDLAFAVGLPSTLTTANRLAPESDPAALEARSERSEGDLMPLRPATAVPLIVVASVGDGCHPPSKLGQFTPSPHTATSKHFQITVRESNLDNHDTSVTLQPNFRPDGFLAGEAQPFELPSDDESPESEMAPHHAPTLNRPATAESWMSLVNNGLERRPDSSRNRLGLGATAWKSHSLAQSERSGTAHINFSHPTKSPGFFKRSNLGLFSSSRGGS